MTTRCWRLSARVRSTGPAWTPTTSNRFRPASPFWDLPDVIVTPHNGVTTAGTARRGFDIFHDNLRRFVADESLVNLVDKAAGY